MNSKFNEEIGSFLFINWHQNSTFPNSKTQISYIRRFSVIFSVRCFSNFVGYFLPYVRKYSPVGHSFDAKIFANRTWFLSTIWQRPDPKSCQAKAIMKLMQKSCLRPEFLPLKRGRRVQNGGRWFKKRAFPGPGRRSWLGAQALQSDPRIQFSSTLKGKGIAFVKIRKKIFFNIFLLFNIICNIHSAPVRIFSMRKPPARLWGHWFKTNHLSTGTKSKT